MDPRHAAALALVSWYLMVPPLSKPPAALATNIDAINAYNRVPQRVPLSQWSLFESFDSADECRAFKDAAYANKEYQFKAGKRVNFDDVVKGYDHYAGVWGECIATDDPRLKGK